MAVCYLIRVTLHIFSAAKVLHRHIEKRIKTTQVRNRSFYVNNKDELKSRRRLRYDRKTNGESFNDDAMRKRVYRQKIRDVISEKRRSAEKKKEYRRNLKCVPNCENGRNINIDTVFKCRTKKHRALKKFKNNLPTTPNKRAAVLTSYLNSHNSPTVNYLQGLHIISSEENITTLKMAESVIGDIKDAIHSTKKKRNDDSRATINIMSAAIAGEGVMASRCKTQLSKKLGITPKRLSKGKCNEKTGFNQIAKSILCP